MSESKTTKLSDAARPLGASGDGFIVQHGNAPSPLNTQTMTPPDEFTLLGVLADIRCKSGVGMKPMLSELADSISDKLDRVWDEAIEAAAMQDEGQGFCASADEIRKLKGKR